MPLPLDGLLVLDFSTLLPGPMATLMLAEAGAEVVKVERPGGEDMRRFPPRPWAPAPPLRGARTGASAASPRTSRPRRAGRPRPLIGGPTSWLEQFRPA
jgi:crotonobetainyl-CoA:carnitine CoA-transferase CaiB-like acyl-CoA transferase